jgi:hypothetical protein
MEITYLTQLSTFNERPFPNEGLSMEQIRDLQEKFNKGKRFPKAFEEYLFIAGEYNNVAYDSPDGLEELQEEVKVALESYGQTIDRPYFAFHSVDWNFLAILLDETDEDPKVYVFEPGVAKKTGSPVIRYAEFTLSKNINERIRRIKDGTF